MTIFPLVAHITCKQRCFWHRGSGVAFDACEGGCAGQGWASDRNIEPLAVPAHPEGVKLKSFFWKKIMPYALLSVPTVSFWEKRDGPIDLDFDKIADLFRAIIAAKKKPIGGEAMGPTELQVLDMKRATVSARVLLDGACLRDVIT